VIDVYHVDIRVVFLTLSSLQLVLLSNDISLRQLQAINHNTLACFSSRTGRAWKIYRCFRAPD